LKTTTAYPKENGQLSIIGIFINQPVIGIEEVEQSAISPGFDNTVRAHDQA
jgi:hypothetical protein